MHILCRRCFPILIALHALLVRAGDAPTNLSQIIPQGGLPARVHVFEDYETEIEKRWWLVGKSSTDNLPPSLSLSQPNTRCWRAGETTNFERKLEDQKVIWKAVIFNPVPGPPMGPRTRLSFRYWLKGTSTLRVQIYSLTNNYHRYLNLTGLPQEKWQAATVDMTAARQPDGGGGPLAEDERIDDIQFYITPDADLLIDDIVLYDEAAPGEKRAFPRRVIFTGWFDTGKQGQEWPGTFTIVPHEKPRTWKFAQSVAREGKDEAWIRVQMRGMRALSKNNELRFRYRLSGSEKIGVVLFNSKTSEQIAAKVSAVKQNEWSETSVALPATTEKPGADEIHFVTETGGVLMLDDVLLYEPGE